MDEILDGFSIRLLAPSIIAKLLTTGDYMTKSVNSSFTVTGGTNTHRPMPGWTFGAVVGASLEGLTRGLAVDLAPIRANIVIAGAIHTELLQKILDHSSAEMLESIKTESSLSSDFGKPEDIAEAYGWIMKDRFANGSMVTSDGGRLLVGAAR